MLPAPFRLVTALFIAPTDSSKLLSTERRHKKIKSNHMWCDRGNPYVLLFVTKDVTSRLPSTVMSDQHWEEREASRLRLLDVWANLATRYSRHMDDDDLVDIRTGEITKDNGVLRNAPTLEFGTLAAPGDEISDADDENDDQDLDEVDELDAFAEIKPGRTTTPMPPVNKLLNQAYADDLQEFLEAEKIRKEQCGTDVEEESEEEQSVWDVEDNVFSLDESTDELDCWEADSSNTVRFVHIVDSDVEILESPSPSRPSKHFGTAQCKNPTTPKSRQLLTPPPSRSRPQFSPIMTADNTIDSDIEIIESPTRTGQKLGPKDWSTTSLKRHTPQASAKKKKLDSSSTRELNSDDERLAFEKTPLKRYTPQASTKKKKRDPSSTRESNSDDERLAFEKTPLKRYTPQASPKKKTRYSSSTRESDFDSDSEYDEKLAFEKTPLMWHTPQVSPKNKKRCPSSTQELVFGSNSAYDGKLAFEDPPLKRHTPQPSPKKKKCYPPSTKELDSASENPQRVPRKRSPSCTDTRISPPPQILCPYPTPNHRASNMPAPIPDPRAQLIIAQAVQQLTALVTGTWQPPPPYYPEGSTPRSTPQRNTSRRSLVSRSRSRGRKVSFQLNDEGSDSQVL